MYQHDPIADIPNAIVIMIGNDKALAVAQLFHMVVDLVHIYGSEVGKWPAVDQKSRIAVQHKERLHYAAYPTRKRAHAFTEVFAPHGNCQQFVTVSADA